MATNSIDGKRVRCVFLPGLVRVLKAKSAEVYLAAVDLDDGEVTFVRPRMNLAALAEMASIIDKELKRQAKEK